MGDQRTVVVTGAAGGIGSAVCDRLRREGARVFALDVRPPAAEMASEFVPVDVLDLASVTASIAAVVERAGRIDGLVAAAGLSEEPTPAESMPVGVWDRTINVNLRGVFVTCQAVGGHMLARGKGSIVAIASMSRNFIVNSPQQQVAYNASKAGVSAMVSLAGLRMGLARCARQRRFAGIRRHSAANEQDRDALDVEGSHAAGALRNPRRGRRRVLVAPG